MPIDFKFGVQRISKDRFHEIDYQVMRNAFDIQNEFGRLYDESIYHSELIKRCGRDGLTVVSEGEIVVLHSTFCKSYFIDALVESGAIYEFKAVESLNGHHESQLLNYMFVMGLSEGKLLNFSPPSVMHRFVSTTVTQLDRYSYQVNDEYWDEKCEIAAVIRGIVRELLADWGAYLEIGLYKEALFHLLGGEERLLQAIDVQADGHIVGCQKFHMLDQEILLHVSSTLNNTQTYRRQLEKLFHNTCIEKIHWVNFSRQRIILTTLKK